MIYNVLLIDDGNATTIADRLSQQKEFHVSFEKPKAFENMLPVIQSGKFDLIVIDLQLTNGGNCYDAPVLAQALRTPAAKSFQDIPIILISSESKITNFYKEMISCKLFDYCMVKSKYLVNHSFYNNALFDIIRSYGLIRQNNDLKTLLSVPEGIVLPATVESCFYPPVHSKNTHEIAIFLLYQIVKPIGILIGEDVLSARLGVEKKSADWEDLKNLLSCYKYNGVFSSMYPRWWAQGVDLWWKGIDRDFIRQLTAEERVEHIVKKTNLKNLEKIHQPAYAKSSRFWTICQETTAALDPLEGFELMKTNCYPWQEQEYVSFHGALLGSSKYRKYATKDAKQRFRSLEKEERCK